MSATQELLGEGEEVGCVPGHLPVPIACLVTLKDYHLPVRGGTLVCVCACQQPLLAGREEPTACLPPASPLACGDRATPYLPPRLPLVEGPRPQDPTGKEEEPCNYPGDITSTALYYYLCYETEHYLDACRPACACLPAHIISSTSGLSSASPISPSVDPVVDRNRWANRQGGQGRLSACSYLPLPPFHITHGGNRHACRAWGHCSRASLNFPSHLTRPAMQGQGGGTGRRIRSRQFGGGVGRWGWVGLVDSLIHSPLYNLNRTLPPLYL